MAVKIALSDRFIGWLVENIDEVRAGTAQYNGLPLRLDAKLRQYQTTVSCLLFTFVKPSRIYVDGHENCFFGALRCTVVSVLFGWWGFPWGPLHTIGSILGNLFGG